MDLQKLEKSRDAAFSEERKRLLEKKPLPSIRLNNKGNGRQFSAKMRARFLTRKSNTLVSDMYKEYRKSETS